MTPTLLIVGATGNTGQGVVTSITDLLKKNNLSYRILGTTRNANSESAKKLSEESGVGMIEKDWTMIDADWLLSNNVQRVFIASHNLPSHFIDESLFLNAALQAGVEYVVRISTTQPNVGPATKVSYARGHWAIETMLEQPAFESMKWASLQPAAFWTEFAPSLIEWVKAFRQTGEKTTFSTPFDADAPVALIDRREVGFIAAHLLSLKDVSPHSTKKYVLSGPSDIKGKDYISLIEKHAGIKVDDVKYRDTEVLSKMLEQVGFPKNVIPSTLSAAASGFNGGTGLEQLPTSPEVLQLYTPKIGAYDALDAAMKEALQ